MLGCTVCVLITKKWESVLIENLTGNGAQANGIYYMQIESEGNVHRVAVIHDINYNENHRNDLLVFC